METTQNSIRKKHKKYISCLWPKRKKKPVGSDWPVIKSWSNPLMILETEFSSRMSSGMGIASFKSDYRWEPTSSKSVYSTTSNTLLVTNSPQIEDIRQYKNIIYSKIRPMKNSIPQFVITLKKKNVNKSDQSFSKVLKKSL